MNWQRQKLDGCLGRWKPDWARLNQNFYDSHPLFDPRFIDPLLKYFSNGSEELLVHRHDGVVDGMVIVRPKRMILLQTYLPAQLQVSALLVGESIALSDMFEAFPNNRVRIDILAADPLYSPAVMSEASNSMEKSKHARTISISIVGSFDQYWASRSKNLRKNLRRYENRIESDGLRLSIRRISDWPEILEALGQHARLESLGWKSAAGTAIQEGSRQHSFYKEVITAFARTKQATIYQLWLGDRLAASRLLIENARMTIVLKTTFDEELGKYSPGQLLLYNLLRREWERKFTNPRSIEFYTNATSEQASWSTAQRNIEHISLFRNKSIQAVLGLGNRIRILRQP